MSKPSNGDGMTFSQHGPALDMARDALAKDKRPGHMYDERDRHLDVLAAERLLARYGRVVVGSSHTRHPDVWARYRSAFLIIGEERRYYETNGPEGQDEHRTAREAAEALVPEVPL